MQPLAVESDDQARCLPVLYQSAAWFRGKSYLAGPCDHDLLSHRFPTQVVELDALPPDELERIVSTAIEDLIDRDAWQAEIEKAKQERGSATPN